MTFYLLLYMYYLGRVWIHFAVLPYTRAPPRHLAQIIEVIYITARLPKTYCVLRRNVSDDGVAPP